MQRVVITGMGIVSCLGNDKETVLKNLKNGQSGIKHNATYAEMGFRSHVSAPPYEMDDTIIDRKLKRFMSQAAMYSYLSALDAIKDAGLDVSDIAQNPRIGVIAGSGGASTASVLQAADNMRAHGLRKVGATMVPKAMSSTVTAALATGLQIHGASYSISSACATSAHCIGHAMELIQLGKQDVVLAGGGEEEHWTQSVLFDAMAAMSSKYNDDPQTASRPYSSDRDGFVIAGGGGMLVIESLEHAQSRGAPILAEIIGYGATSDGASMVAPSGDGAMRCITQALLQAQTLQTQALRAQQTENSQAQTQKIHIDYINTHGTATKLGDVTELNAIRQAFNTLHTDSESQLPPISATKSMTGHSLGAAGVQELIYSLIMMQNDFIAPSINISTLDPEAQAFDIVTETRPAKLNCILSNSFGFGGTNASLIVKKWSGEL